MTSGLFDCPGCGATNSIDNILNDHFDLDEVIEGQDAYPKCRGMKCNLEFRVTAYITRRGQAWLNVDWEWFDEQREGKE